MHFVRGAEPLVAFQDAGAPFGAGFCPTRIGTRPFLHETERPSASAATRSPGTSRRRAPAARRPLARADAFVEAEVVLRRLAHLVVEVARDDALVDALLVVRVVDPVLELEELRVGERRDLRVYLSRRSLSPSTPW